MPQPTTVYNIGFHPHHEGPQCYFHNSCRCSVLWISCYIYSYLPFTDPYMRSTRPKHYSELPSKVHARTTRAMATVAREVEPKHSRRENVTTITNDLFQPLLLAGTGSVGDTWICVSNPEAMSSTSVLNALSNKGGPESLYAVKIPSARKQDSLPQEIVALNHIAAISAPADKHMQQYVDHDQLHEEPA